MADTMHGLWPSPAPSNAPYPPSEPKRPLCVLLLVAAHSTLSQRTRLALAELGHAVTVEVVDSSEEMEAAVMEHTPELVVCPWLEVLIPESVWSRHRCLIVSPGPNEDRGESSIDWAVELGPREWKLTVVEAHGASDGDPVQAVRSFPVREAGPGGLYRHEARHAAVDALADAIVDVATSDFQQEPAHRGGASVIGRPRAALDQVERMLDWSADGTSTILARLEADARAGVLDVIGGLHFNLFGGHPERLLRGEPGDIIARRHGAICRATVDGAVWISHLRRPPEADSSMPKLPATLALSLAGIALDVPEIPLPAHAPIPAGQTYRDVWYEEAAGVGYLHFEFNNGAMDTEQCRRLRSAYHYARERSETRVIVLMGGGDFWSNGLHLNVIEVDGNPGEASWRNLLAMDDLVRDVIETDSHLVVAALAGHAGAGGVPLALAADYVFARESVVLNPYYQHMGGLYGSEYWTYLLPRRVGPERAMELTTACKPVGTSRAVEIGMLDAAFGSDVAGFRSHAERLAVRIARDPDIVGWLEDKCLARMRDEHVKPLEAYRAEELARCHACFFGEDRSYHEARRRFVYKLRSPGPAPSSAPPVAWTASTLGEGPGESFRGASAT